MFQIIQENRRPSFGQKFSNAVGTGLESGSQLMQGMQAQKRESEAAKTASQLLGFDASSLDPQTRNQLVMEAFKQQGAENLQSNKFAHELQKTQQKQEEGIAPLQGAMDILNRMKGLRKKGNLGIGSNISPFEQTRKEAGEYEQLGKSLIQYATNIPIRNRIEFETLAENLYDPTTTDAKAEGILNAMQRIIENSLEAAGYKGEQEENTGKKTSIGTKRSLSSFKIGSQ